MSNNLITGTNTIGVGEIRFYDSIQPPLPAGSYTLSATQTVKDLPGELSDPQYVAEQPLRVDGPRFVLNPAQINTIYPPANQIGQFDNALPHMVFNNFALPWSREINPLSKTIDPTPWLGLLTLYPDDLPSTINPNAPVSTPQTIPVSQLVKPLDAKILPPVLGDIFEPEDTKVTVVDINLAFFQAIAPTLTELPFLAHGRQVNTRDKVMQDMDADGCFSLVVGNRLPLAVDNGVTKNSVYLVSYEGHQDHLNGSTIPGNYDKIRLVLLGGWEFTAAAARGSFIQLMEDLCDEGRGGVTLYQMPVYQPDVEPVPDTVVEEALAIGYVPLQNDMRVGEKASAWYRGPLVPAPTKRDHEYGPYLFSDHAMHYDPETGLFNHAYSAAWQIGRLLALSDATFAKGLFNWRNSYVAKVSNDAKNETVRAKAALLMSPETGALPINMLTALQSLMATQLSQVSWPKVNTRAKVSLGEHLPGVLTQDEIDSIYQNDADPLIELDKKLKGA